MNQKIHQAISLFAGIVFTASIFCAEGCKKQDSKASVQTDQVANMDKMVKFLSVTLNVAADEVLFDKGSKDFYVANSPYREALADLQKRYDNANEYKLNYENK